MQSKPDDNKGRFALVTGASSGIGWHISSELAARGYHIVAVSNQQEKLVELKTMIQSRFGTNTTTLCQDLSRPDAAQKVFNFCEESGLEIDVLVNNAGILVFGEVSQVEITKAEAILQLHMNTPALLCRMFGEAMLKRKHGFILNVSSISTVMPYPGISLYGPTKTFLRYFTRALRTEMKADGINVTCLIPGATATELHDASRVNMQLALKLRVMKKPESVAAAGVKALFAGHAECVPGILNKLVMLIVPLVPNLVIAAIHRRTRRKLLMKN